VDYLRDRVGAANYCAEMRHEDEEVLVLGKNLHLQTTDGVVEVQHGRLQVSVVRVFFVGVLVSVVVADGALVVPSRHDIQVVVHRLPLPLLHHLILQQM
jgi:hypothetical protein